METLPAAAPALTAPVLTAPALGVPVDAALRDALADPVLRELLADEPVQDAPPPCDRPPPSVRLRPIGLCAAWSHHAADLALPLGAELQRWEETPTTAAMVARGEIVRLLPGVFLPPDLLGTSVRRALALGCALGEHLQSHHVIAGRSAAWVHLGGRPPASLEMLSPAHRGILAGVVQRHARLGPGDIDTVGGAPVTTPRRTASDLLRFSPEAIARPLLRRLERAGLVEHEELRAHLHRLHRHPGVQEARERLDRALTPLAARSDSAQQDGTGRCGPRRAPEQPPTVRPLAGVRLEGPLITARSERTGPLSSP